MTDLFVEDDESKIRRMFEFTFDLEDNESNSKIRRLETELADARNLSMRLKSELWDVIDKIIIYSNLLGGTKIPIYSTKSTFTTTTGIRGRMTGYYVNDVNLASKIAIVSIENELADMKTEIGRLESKLVYYKALKVKFETDIHPVCTQQG